jgi:TIR domain-containing protein
VPEVVTHSETLIHNIKVTVNFGYGLPAKCLDIVGEPVRSTGVPAQLSAECFGDPSLVYDVTERLTTPGMHDVGSALGGAPPGYAQLPGESLAKFIESRGRGVIVFDDLQVFIPRAVDTLAEIADSGLVCEEGSPSPTVSAKQFVILAFARLALPSPNELVRRAKLSRPWEPDDRPPPTFRDVIERIARERYPEHFRSWVVGRFEGVKAGFAWERYCELLDCNQLDTPVFDEPKAPPIPSAQPQPMARDVVADVAVIPELADGGEPYDVFISYSWSRTEDNASWLRDQLRSRGLRVFFDKDDLDISGVADVQLKTVLIQRLSANVKNSRAWVVFAAALRPFFLNGKMTEEEALKRGLAMEVNGALTEWSWQTLELRHMRRHLVIGDKAAYLQEANGDWNPSFGQRRIDDREDILNYVMAYLSDMGILHDSDSED